MKRDVDNNPFETAADISQKKLYDFSTKKRTVTVSHFFNDFGLKAHFLQSNYWSVKQNIAARLDLCKKLIGTNCILAMKVSLI